MNIGRSFLLTVIAVFFLYNPYVALASQVNIADITVTPSEAPQAGVPLTVTVNASSADGSPVYYKFYYCANYGTSEYETTTWTVVQPYSTSNTAQYTFNQAGKYIIVVRAVNDPNNEPVALPIVGHVIDVGGTNEVTLTGLSKNPSTPSKPGETIQFTANAVTYLNAVIYYKFYYCANYGTSSYASTPWTLIQDYSTDNTCNYTFPSGGDYIVVARAVTDPNNEPAALPIVGQVVNVTSSVTPSGDCGAYVAQGVWKQFDCYNLAAIGKTTGDDPFTPSWRLIGGYWQWGRKGPDSSQWYDTNTPNFAHGPTGPDESEANSGDISGWDTTDAPDGSWSDTVKTANDPCPAGFRVPTNTQWVGVLNNNTQSIVGTWSNNATNYSAARFFGNDLMLPAAGDRYGIGGELRSRGRSGYYWSSTLYSSYGSYDARFLYFYSSHAGTWDYGGRRSGYSVRCVAE